MNSEKHSKYFGEEENHDKEIELVEKEIISLQEKGIILDKRITEFLDSPEYVEEDYDAMCWNAYSIGRNKMHLEYVSNILKNPFLEAEADTIVSEPYIVRTRWRSELAAEQDIDNN